jgi:cell wall-associated NlpC family hydrolase
MMTPEQIVDARSRIIDIAKTWLNTPYQAEARVRLGGVDCATLPLEVYKAAGIVTEVPAIPHYPADWAVHQDTPLYLDLVERVVRDNGFVEVAPPPEREPLPGDFLLFHFARAHSHGAIVIQWPLCIHAHMRRGVIYVDALKNSELARKINGGLVKCFSPLAGGLSVR